MIDDAAVEVFWKIIQIQNINIRNSNVLGMFTHLLHIFGQRYKEAEICGSFKSVVC
jgi:hypothetical protein